MWFKSHYLQFCPESRPASISWRLDGRWPERFPAFLTPWSRVPAAGPSLHRTVRKELDYNTRLLQYYWCTEWLHFNVIGCNVNEAMLTIKYCVHVRFWCDYGFYNNFKNAFLDLQITSHWQCDLTNTAMHYPLKRAAEND